MKAEHKSWSTSAVADVSNAFDSFMAASSSVVEGDGYVCVYPLKATVMVAQE